MMTKIKRAKGRKPAPSGQPNEPRTHGRLTQYDPVHCARLVAHAEAGGSFVDYADAIGVPPSTLIAWARAHPEFLRALQLALATLALDAAHQIDDVRDALLLRCGDLQRRLLAATDEAEVDQLMRSLSDLAPKAWPEHAESLLAWHATENVCRQGT